MNAETLRGLLCCDGAVRRAAEEHVESLSPAALEEGLVAAVRSAGLDVDLRCVAAVLLRRRLRRGVGALLDVVVQEDLPSTLRRRVADALAAAALEDAATASEVAAAASRSTDLFERLCAEASPVVLSRVEAFAERAVAFLQASDDDARARAVRAAAVFCLEASETPHQLALAARVLDAAVACAATFSAVVLEAARDLASARAPLTSAVAHYALAATEAPSDDGSRELAFQTLAALFPQRGFSVDWQAFDAAVARAIGDDVTRDEEVWWPTAVTADDDDDEYVPLPPSAQDPPFRSALGPAAVEACAARGALPDLSRAMLSDSSPRVRLAGLSVLDDEDDSSKRVFAEAAADACPRVRAAAFEAAARAYLFDDDDEVEKDWFAGLVLDEDDARRDRDDEAAVLLAEACVAAVRGAATNLKATRVAIFAATALANLAPFCFRVHEPVLEALCFAVTSLVFFCQDVSCYVFVAEAAKAAAALRRVHGAATQRVLEEDSFGGAALRCLAVVETTASSSSSEESAAALACAACLELCGSQVFRDCCLSPHATLERGALRAGVRRCLHDANTTRHFGDDLLATLAVCRRRMQADDVAFAARALYRLLKPTRGLQAVVLCARARDEAARALATGLCRTPTSNSVAVVLASAAKRLVSRDEDDAVSYADDDESAVALVGPPLAEALRRLARSPVRSDAFWDVAFSRTEALGAVAEALAACGWSSSSSEALGSWRLVREAVAAVDDDDDAGETLDQLAALADRLPPPTQLDGLPPSFVCRALPAARLVSLLDDDDEDARVAACRSLACCEALVAVVLSGRDDDLRRCALGRLAGRLPELSPSVAVAVVPRLSLLHDEPAESRRAYHALVTALVVRGGPVPAVFQEALLAAATAADEVSSQMNDEAWWASCVLLRPHAVPSRAAGILLRRHFPSDDAARQAAQIAHAKRQLVDAATRHNIARLLAPK